MSSTPLRTYVRRPEPASARASGVAVGRGRRAGRLAATLLAAVPLAGLAGVLVLLALGYRPMIEQSDSMAPTMRAGDVLFVKQIVASQGRPGDVLTFQDAEHAGRTLTHRVVSVTPADPGGLAFVTRGDANTGTEKWSVAPTGTVGRYAFRVRWAGHAVRQATSGPWRAIVVLAAALLALEFLRHVWRRA